MSVKSTPLCIICRSCFGHFVFIPALLLLLPPLVAASLSTEIPRLAAPSFLNGERLVYDISWSGLRVGEGTLESVPGFRWADRDVIHIISTATSNRFISYFFPVRDRVETVIDSDGLYPYRFEADQKHGFRHRKKEIIFDQESHTAVLLFKGKTTEHEIPPQVQDSLSCLYYFRSLPTLETGKSVFIDVHESKKNWKLEIQVVGRETLETVLGTIPTVKAKALVRFEGVLMDKGDVYVWLTDDARRIPVMIRGNIIIGAIHATLSRADPPQLSPTP